jgi:lysophospholipase L1-like esterase/GNAT superfamily N-acetyltransferase
MDPSYRLEYLEPRLSLSGNGLTDEAVALSAAPSETATLLDENQSEQHMTRSLGSLPQDHDFLCRGVDCGIMSEVKILCYGDSNTWGFSPVDGSRFPEEICWPGVLRRCLGEQHTVVEEGLNGRTLCSCGMEGDPLNGSEHVLSVLRAHGCFDLVIFYLGINDLFIDPQISVEAMAGELGRAIDKMRDVAASVKILLLSPLPVNVAAEYRACYHEQIEKSLDLVSAYRSVADRKGCHFLDASRVISASRRDGVHLEAEEHRELGRHLCTLVWELLPDSGTETVGLVMIRENLFGLPHFDLPAGFTWRAFRPGDEPLWARLETSAGEFCSILQAAERFEQEFGGHQQELAERCLFLENESGESIGTAMGWYGTLLPGGIAGRLHWVGIRKEYQGRGLGRPLVGRALELLSRLHERAYLTTQPKSIAGIRLYLDCGFRPYLTDKAQEEEWAKISKRLGIPDLDVVHGFIRTG